MGKVMVVYRVYPEDGVDLDKLSSALWKTDKVKAVQREPIAFGLEVIKVGLLLDDKTDNPLQSEENLRKVPGVKILEELDVTLIS